MDTDHTILKSKGDSIEYAKFTRISTRGFLVMGMKLSRAILTLSFFIFTISSNVALAVSIGHANEGQVLIFPFFSTQQQNTSLITVARGGSGTGQPKAIKIRFVDGNDGADLTSFNVYLGRGDSWVAAVHADGENSKIVTNDNSCTVPGLSDATISEFSKTVGYIVVIEMGIITDEGIEESINEFNCEDLQNSWESGQWQNNPSFGLAPPTGGLRGTISLINVPIGTMYTVQASSLDQFSDISQHTQLSDHPNLSTVHDAGTDEGKTSSQVCYSGECYFDEWERPIDAVSAVLTAQAMRAEFSTEQVLNAKAEWVVTYPTRRFQPSEQGGSGLVSLAVQDREGTGPVFPPCIPDGTVFGCTTHYLLVHEELVEVVEFGNSQVELGQSKSSGILGKQLTVDFPNDDELPEAGLGRLGMEGFLTSNSGRLYFGAPAIGFALQEFTNGVLVGEDGKLQRANYGSEVELSNELRLEE